MGTSNFMPHENGIFVIEGLTEEEIIESLKEDGFIDEGEEITDEMIEDEWHTQYEFLVNDFPDIIHDELGMKGYTVNDEGDNTFTVWKQGKHTERIVAELTMRAGYYSHVQIIVETDKDELLEEYVGCMDTVTEEREHYTPHNKKLFEVMNRLTKPLQVVARFSNGETFYQ